MKTAIILFAGFIIISGTIMLIIPNVIYSFVEEIIGESWMYYAAIILRLIFGIIFIKSASLSKFPIVIKILGFLAIFAALSFIYMGQENFQEFMASMMASMKPYARISGVFSIAFGGFLIYAYRNKKDPLES